MKTKKIRELLYQADALLLQAMREAIEMPLVVEEIREATLCIDDAEARLPKPVRKRKPAPQP